MKRLSTLVVLAVAAACGVDPSSQPSTADAPARGTSPLEATFDSAAREYQVPIGLLKSISYIETRVGPTGGPSITGGHGVMALVSRDDWNMVARASQLTATDARRLEVDEVANIRGAAAVLRELADKSFADYRDLNPHEVGDWYHAVSL